MDRRRVLIVGGGIAVLALAPMLARPGVAVEVIERSPVPATDDQGQRPAIPRPANLPRQPPSAPRPALSQLAQPRSYAIWRAPPWTRIATAGPPGTRAVKVGQASVMVRFADPHARSTGWLPEEFR
jgi:glycine/D-amino acid oxidase-like deaminating enzyme